MIYDSTLPKEIIGLSNNKYDSMSDMSATLKEQLRDLPGFDLFEVPAVGNRRASLSSPSNNLNVFSKFCFLTKKERISLQS